MQHDVKVPQDIMDDFLAGKHDLDYSMVRCIARMYSAQLVTFIRQAVGLPEVSASATADMRDVARRLSRA